MLALFFPHKTYNISLTDKESIISNESSTGSFYLFNQCTCLLTQQYGLLSPISMLNVLAKPKWWNECHLMQCFSKLSSGMPRQSMFLLPPCSIELGGSKNVDCLGLPEDSVEKHWCNDIYWPKSKTQQCPAALKKQCKSVQFHARLQIPLSYMLVL